MLVSFGGRGTLSTTPGSSSDVDDDEGSVLSVSYLAIMSRAADPDDLDDDDDETRDELCAEEEPTSGMSCPEESVSTGLVSRRTISSVSPS